MITADSSNDPFLHSGPRIRIATQFPARSPENQMEVNRLFAALSIRDYRAATFSTNNGDSASSPALAQPQREQVATASNPAASSSVRSSQELPWELPQITFPSFEEVLSIFMDEPWIAEKLAQEKRETQLWTNPNVSLEVITNTARFQIARLSDLPQVTSNIMKEVRDQETDRFFSEQQKRMDEFAKDPLPFSGYEHQQALRAYIMQCAQRDIEMKTKILTDSDARLKPLLDEHESAVSHFFDESVIAVQAQAQALSHSVSTYQSAMQEILDNHHKSVSRVLEESEKVLRKRDEEIRRTEKQYKIDLGINEKSLIFRATQTVLTVLTSLFPSVL